MMVAKLATVAALALSGLGLFAAMTEGDLFLAAAALSGLFVAALFWTLAEIGERLRPAPEATLAPAAPAPIDPVARSEFDENGMPDLAALERKLAAARR